MRLVWLVGRERERAIEGEQTRERQAKQTALMTSTLPTMAKPKQNSNNSCQFNKQNMHPHAHPLHTVTVPSICCSCRCILFLLFLRETINAKLDSDFGWWRRVSACAKTCCTVAFLYTHSHSRIRAHTHAGTMCGCVCVSLSIFVCVRVLRIFAVNFYIFFITHSAFSNFRQLF